MLLCGGFSVGTGYAPLRYERHYPISSQLHRFLYDKLHFVRFGQSLIYRQLHGRLNIGGNCFDNITENVRLGYGRYPAQHLVALTAECDIVPYPHSQRI